jgi:hypothetical protein
MLNTPLLVQDAHRLMLDAPSLMLSALYTPLRQAGNMQQWQQAIISS